MVEAIITRSIHMNISRIANTVANFESATVDQPQSNVFEPQQDGLWREPTASLNPGDGLQYAPKGGRYPKLPDEDFDGTTVRPAPGKPVRVECPPGTHPETTTNGGSSTTTCVPNEKKDGPEKTKPVNPGDAPILD
jgi:hypothetical protein